ncbi:WbqC family protein [Streptomyces sp. NPDC058471]|uniref:WbqC family protein n=1 Tax=Streptomyces sp. NPDC058471 TaxID=3346516 RepID=UPI0036676711
MPRTCLSSTTGSPAGSPARDLPPAGGLCAIHQPNLFPRLSTLAKLFAADYWIVLDDVQFARRDYQHRALLASLAALDQRQWLTLPTRLPHGRSTVIREARLADPVRSRRRVTHMLSQHYKRSPYWPLLRAKLDAVTAEFAATDRTARIAEVSTRILLDLLGWEGRVLRSSQFVVRPDRSLRLVDLAVATGATGYLCGPGGMKYLSTEPFSNQGLPVIPFVTPADGIWQGGRDTSALSPLMMQGPLAITGELMELAVLHGISHPAA